MSPRSRLTDDRAARGRLDGGATADARDRRADALNIAPSDAVGRTWMERRRC